MSYRSYIGKISKNRYDKIKSYVKDDLENVRFFDFIDTLYDFGKYTNYTSSGIPMEDFFTNDESNKYISIDHDLKIVNKDFLEYIIEEYRLKIVSLYSDIKGDNVRLDYLISMIITVWEKFKPYNLDIGVDKIVETTRYEYAIFELVRIYKTFDWENDVMVFYGY